MATDMILPVLLPLLASAAALVAARDGRSRDMGLAAGIAAVLSPAGLALLPVLLGTAIARGAAGRAIAAFAIAVAATTSLGEGWLPIFNVSIWTVAPHDLHGLLAAVAAGGAAWLAACCSARCLAPREQADAALIACLAGPLVLPLGVAPLALALGLAIGGARLRLPVRGANDDPLPLRATA